MSTDDRQNITSVKNRFTGAQRRSKCCPGLPTRLSPFASSCLHFWYLFLIIAFPFALQWRHHNYLSVNIWDRHQQLQKIIDLLSMMENFVVQGDWNAEVRRDAQMPQADWGDVCGPSF